MGLFQSPNNSTVMGAVPRERLGIASGLLSLSRTSGNTVGVSLIGAVFGTLIASMSAGADVSVAPPDAIVAGFQGTFRFAALILCGAAVTSILRIGKRKGGGGQRIKRRITNTQYPMPTAQCPMPNAQCPITNH